MKTFVFYGTCSLPCFSYSEHSIKYFPISLPAIQNFNDRTISPSLCVPHVLAVTLSYSVSSYLILLRGGCPPSVHHYRVHIIKSVPRILGKMGVLCKASSPIIRLLLLYVFVIFECLLWARHLLPRPVSQITKIML